MMWRWFAGASLLVAVVCCSSSSAINDSSPDDPGRDAGGRLDAATAIVDSSGIGIDVATGSDSAVTPDAGESTDGTVSDGSLADVRADSPGIGYPDVAYDGFVYDAPLELDLGTIEPVDAPPKPDL